MFPCGPGEVVANLGAYFGDIVASFVNTYGAARHIREDRPKMALSVYHNNEDLWKIPE